MVIGIGSIHKSIRGIKHSCREAWRASEIGIKEYSEGNLFFIKDLYIESIIDALRENEKRWLIEDTISDILELNYADDLLKTIIAWCDCGFNNKLTSGKTFYSQEYFKLPS